MTKPRTPNCHTPAEPKLTNEQERQRKARYQILADSELNRALWRVKQAAEELESLIANAEDAHMRDMTEVVLADLGLEPGDEIDDLANWHDDVHGDLIGFKWSLNQFADLLHVLGKRPADLDDTDADTPAIVSRRG